MASCEPRHPVGLMATWDPGEKLCLMAIGEPGQQIGLMASYDVRRQMAATEATAEHHLFSFFTWQLLSADEHRTLNEN
jgi:hypothetical protein